MTAPGEINIHDPFQIVTGDDWEDIGVCHEVDGSLMDLAGAFVEWFLSSGPDGARLATLDTDGSGGITILLPPSGDPPTGRVKLFMSRAQTAQLSPGWYFDQLRVTTSDGARQTQWMGRVQIVQGL